MSDPGPYSRVYWTVLDDKKFDAIRADMRHFGAWTLMLVLNDMAYPAPAFVPPTVSKTSLKALVDAGLVVVLPARMYRIKGLKTERERRSEQGKPGARARWDRNATALPSDSEGTAIGMPDETRRDETSKGIDETSTARDDEPVSDEETDLFAYIAQRGAFIRPDSGFGRRLLGLMDRRGADAVVAEAKALYQDEPMSDRQWVFGLEKALEAIPSPPMDELPLESSPAEIRNQRALEQTAARRLEYFKLTGLWDPNFGPEPEWDPEWGDRVHGKQAVA